MELCWIRHHLHRLETGHQQSGNSTEITGENVYSPTTWQVDVVGYHCEIDS